MFLYRGKFGYVEGGRDTHIMLESVPIIPFFNSFDFILLFLKFSPIIPKIIPPQVEPRPGENKNFINIMDVELEISPRFSILFEICIMVKETNNA
jgi:hypothetical protein